MCLFKVLEKARVCPDRYWVRFPSPSEGFPSTTTVNHLDNNDYASRLQACIDNRDFSQARLLHREIISIHPNLLETNAFIANLLIATYRKSGSLHEARATFDHLKLKNVISWNSILATYADHGEFEAALLAFNQMLLDGTVPSVVTFISVLRACVALDDLESGTRLHSYLFELGFHTDIVVSNVLVTLYGKCGDLEQAWTIFRGTSSKSTVSWTSIAAANCDNGDFCEALKLLREMVLDGFRHNSRSFSTALRACGSVEEVREIHRQVLESGLLLRDGDIAVGNGLINTYGKLGAPEFSLEAFEEIEARNASSWNALIASYAQNGCSQQALRSFSRLLLEGFFPDRTSFAGGVLSCCCGRNNAKFVRGCVEEAGFNAEVGVTNALISFYSRNGTLEEAENIFQRLENPNLVSWNAIISACVQNDSAERAVQLFREMQLRGFMADKFTLTSLLSACWCLSLGSQILEWIRTERQRDSLGIAALNMFARCGLPDRARELFDEMSSKKNVVLWNELIKSYVDNGCSDEAVQVFRLMLLEAAVSPNSVTFARVLAACEDPWLAKVVENLVLESGWEEDPQVSNALMSILARHGTPEQALERVISREQQHNNVVAWTAMITGFGEKGWHEEAAKIFRRMRVEGVKPDRVAFTAMLSSCAAAMNTVEGRVIHAQVLESSLESDSMVASSLVALYARSGKLVTAYKILKSIEQHQQGSFQQTLVISWNNFVGGCIQHGHYATAVKMFHRMLLDGITPNKVSFITILAACSLESISRVGQLVHACCLESGLFHDVIVKNSLADMYGKLGNLTLAREILEKLPVKNSVSWNATISGYAQHGRGREAVTLFWEMQQDGSRANAITFARVLSSVDSREAGVWFESMQSDHGLVPGVEHFRAVVELLGRAGKLDEAARVIPRVPREFQAALWLSFLGSCRKRGELQRERLAAEKILELDATSIVARQVVNLFEESKKCEEF